MTLLEQINNDMISYMKNKDSFSLGVVRMVKGAIQLEKINKKRDLTDEEVVAVIAKQIKMRNDSITEFSKANRTDLVEQYQKEITLLEGYMPEQLSIEEINKIIDEAFTKVNPTSSKDMGLIMKEVSPKLKGKADMSNVSTIIKEKLQNL
ncbi:MAG: GatB/YqeY domain-containing protein [Mycoplasmatota bacterium]|nr:GatB/YqeY domain-containing protein [Mycoplasmatota bacterium]